MARPIKVETSFREGTKRVKVADETKYLMGGIEGPWWFKFSWWVIPSGLALFITPWVLLARGCGSSPDTSRAQEPPPPISIVKEDTIYGSTVVVLPKGETDDEETHRSTIHLP